MTPQPFFDPSTFQPAPQFTPPTFDPSTAFPPTPTFDPSTAFPPTPTFDPSTAFPPAPTFDPSTAFPPAPTFDPSTAFPPAPTFDPSTAFPPPTFDPGTTFPPPTFDPGTAFPPPTFDPGTAYPPTPTFDPGTAFPPPTFDPGTTFPPPTFDPGTTFPPPTFDPGDPGIPPPFVDPSTAFSAPSFELAAAPLPSDSEIPPLPSFDVSPVPPPEAALVSAVSDPGQAGSTSDAGLVPPSPAPAQNEVIISTGFSYNVNGDGTSYFYDKEIISGPDGQLCITRYENRPDGSIIVHQSFESEDFQKDHTLVWAPPPQAENPVPVPQNPPTGDPQPAPSNTPASEPLQSPLVQGLGGFVTGAGLSQVPLVGSLIGPAAQSAGLVEHPTKNFQTGYGLGAIAAGVYQGVSGAGMLLGGGGEAVGGVAAVPVSGGTSAVVSAVGVSEMVLGGLLVAQGSANITVGVQTLTNAQLTNPIGGRPTPPQSEQFAAGNGTGGVPVRSQYSYKGGKPVRFGLPGSTRPDLELPEAGVVVEVKNYDLSRGNANLVRNVVTQAIKRANELPAGTKQALVIDVRGQAISHSQLTQLFQQINAQSGNLFDNRWWVFMN